MTTSSEATRIVAICRRLVKTSWLAFWVTCTGLSATAPPLLIHSVTGRTSLPTFMIVLAEGLPLLLGALMLIMFFLVILLLRLGALHQEAS